MFHFRFDTDLQMNNSPHGFHQSSSNLVLDSTPSGLVYSQTGVHGSFQVSTPNLNLSGDKFQLHSSGSNYGSLSMHPNNSSQLILPSFESQLLAELLKNPQAFEMYKSWKENSVGMSQTVSNLVKQHGDFQQQNNTLQNEINALKLELQLLQKQNLQ